VANGTARRPLEGLKVLDFTWVMAGPAVTRLFSDFGATVVKIESSTRVDAARTQLPFKDGVAGAERSAVYANYNGGKLGLALNLSVPEARDVVRRLVQWADVLTEAFTPKTMRNWGLGYEDVRDLNPRLIYASSCLAGAYGPYSQFGGYGNIGAALAGFNYLVAWPDRPPAGPGGAYTDYVVPKFMELALLAALEHRDRTGRGQYIDLSQTEAAMHFITPALLDYEVNGRLIAPDGNRSDDMSPHGVFRCQGEDRWVALAVRDDGDWRVLCGVIGAPNLAGDPELATREGRKRNEDRIEHAIEAWTSARTAERAQEQLIGAGLPAHLVANHVDFYEDPQLALRGHFVEVPHHELGTVVVENTRFLMSRTPAIVAGGPPTYGEHSQYILREILGMQDDEIARLAELGALE
jgi:crotonobetainyl-CoA:carnitine CoA-transferase CaiB-like acyl-CoA transferase